MINTNLLFADELAESFYSISRMINSRNPYKKKSIRNRSIVNRFTHIIEWASKKWGIDPFLISSIIKHESSFDPNAISKKGACGLMQLMPDTAKQMGVTAIFDPTQNINGGTHYIKMMNDRYGGNLFKALLAYNAGPSKIDHGIIPEESYEYANRVILTYRQLKRNANGN